MPSYIVSNIPRRRSLRRVAILWVAFTPTDMAPVPQIIQLSPSALPAGDPAFTLTVTCKNFASNAVLLWDGAALSPTLFISHTQLQAFVGADLVALPGPAPVTAANPGPGGGAAQALFYRLWQAWMPLTGNFP